LKHRQWALVDLGLLPDYWNIFYLVCSISASVNKPFLQMPAMRADVLGRRVVVADFGPDECCSAAICGAVTEHDCSASQARVETGGALKVCIFGAGAIGGFLGVQLASSGAEVSLVARGAHLAAMRAEGLRLQIDGIERVARLPCTDTPAELGVQDFLVIAMKAHDITAALATMAPLIGPGTAIVTASNGLPYWYFHVADVPHSGTLLDSVDPGGAQWRALGKQPTIGCVVLPATEVVAPGVIRHEHGRKFPIGEPDGRHSSLSDDFREIMAAGGLEAPVRDDIRSEIWLKLCGNVCFNPLSALTLATLDSIVGDPGTRALCQAMMEEARDVGQCLGVTLRVDLSRRLDGAAAVGPHKMSMLQDLEHGRSLEVEPLVGVVQELGRLTGVPTPTVDVVLALIRQRVEATRLH
jgi:2-dehydropantoate 2-reductase